MPDKNYFEALYKGPFKGVDVSMPENFIEPQSSPLMQNCILKNGEIRSRPQQRLAIPSPSNLPVLGAETFLDANGIYHTCIVDATGLWQLNRMWPQALANNQYNKIWAKVGVFPVQPGPNIPLALQVFVNKLYWTNGSNNLWTWDGILSTTNLSSYQINHKYYVNQQIKDKNGDWQIVTQAGTSGGSEPAWVETVGTVTADGPDTLQWTQNGKPFIGNGGIQNQAIVDATNGISAGAFFLGELGSSLLMLNTVEGPTNTLGVQNFAQRVRWCPSGIPNIWDPNVNIGAGFEDLLDTPDSITGYFSIGTTGFIFRVNGITEISLNNSGTAPFNFNHLWASDHGIGNVYPFSIASYGPIGIFISLEEIYLVSLGGFEVIGKEARDAIMLDLANAIGSPIATIFPIYKQGYVYPQYVLSIPQPTGNKSWRYSVEDKSWQPDFRSYGFLTGRPNFVAVS